MHYRIILSKEQQKLLVNKAREKSNLSWILLSKELNCSYGYLLNEIRNSKRTLSENLYKRLCSLAEVDFDKFIIKRINSNWGQIKGANNIKHRKNLFKSKNPVVLCKCSNSLAEIIGIIIGDGSLYVLPKKGIYRLHVCGNALDEKEYILDYVKPLFENIFKIKFSTRETKNSIMIYKNSKSIMHTLKYYGLKYGNKKLNKTKIPNWIIQNKEYLKYCIKGIVDTDGSVYLKNKTNLYPNISISSRISTIRKSITLAFVKLNFETSNWNENSSDICIRKRIFVEKYYKEIGFGNPKHLRRFQKFIKFNAPVV